MPIIKPDEVVRVDLPELGEWVEIKTRRSRGAEIRIRRKIVGSTRLRTGGAIQELEAGDYIDAAEYAEIEEALVRWSFEEPISAEAIRELDGDSVDAIKTAINAQYGQREAEEKNRLGGNGATSSSDEGAFLPISLG